MKTASNGGFLCMAIAALLSMNGSAWGNNVTIPAGSVVLEGLNLTQGTVRVKFDIRWENSWRLSTAQANWDAAWVFLKFSTDGTTWSHCTLATNGHTGPAACKIDVGLTGGAGKGVFLYSSAADYEGNPSYEGVSLVWNWNADGFDFRSKRDVSIGVQAIEMVYIPEGAFSLGYKNSYEAGAFYQYPGPAAYPIISEAAILVGATNGDLCYTTGANMGDGLGPIPAGYPKGYQAFYCMKYPISQGQYADFLSKLPAAQVSSRFATSAMGVNRYTITNSPSYYAIVPDRVCNYLAWVDGCAYADWACLRPMTEMEYEKACRGTLAAVPSEYPWGDTTLNTLDYTFYNDLASNATVNLPTPAAGNALYSSTYDNLTPLGPLRCGIFAASTSNPTRAQAAAGYYGVMDVAGAVRGRYVSAGKPEGRAFDGSHGDGVLNAGYANQSNWPGYSTGTLKVDVASGSGMRGEYWNSPSVYLYLSGRPSAAAVDGSRGASESWRGARTAP
jgi:hypothetical protein